MQATNMTTAELVRYGLMYSESLPASVARESLERLEDAQAEINELQCQVSAYESALDTLGLSGVSAYKLEPAFEEISTRCDKAEKFEGLLRRVAISLECDPMNKAERAALARTIMHAIHE